MTDLHTPEIDAAFLDLLDKSKATDAVYETIKTTFSAAVQNFRLGEHDLDAVEKIVLKPEELPDFIPQDGSIPSNLYQAVRHVAGYSPFNQVVYLNKYFADPLQTPLIDNEDMAKHFIEPAFLEDEDQNSLVRNNKIFDFYINALQTKLDENNSPDMSQLVQDFAKNKEISDAAFVELSKLIKNELEKPGQP